MRLKLSKLLLGQFLFAMIQGSKGVVSMILTMDIGNSHIVVGVFSNNQLTHKWSMETVHKKTADEYAMQLKGFFDFVGLQFEAIEGIIMSSVVPSMMYTFEALCKSYFRQKPLIVGPGVKTGLNIKYENQREVGSDRIVNAIGALQQYSGERPIIIVDFGTATTYCYLNERGEYLGGAIAPGLHVSTEALYERAAKLPRIEITVPPNVIGRNTVHAMQSGIVFGWIGQVEGIVNRMKAQSETEPLVVATGSMASLIADATTAIDFVDEDLTLKGLYTIYQRNRS